VVPLRHDEYPRFIVGAYPFYAATVSTSAAFLVFCAAWLSLGPEGAGAGVKGAGGKGKAVKFE
jgi:oligosaccharyltransferase complex subunit beta